MYAVLSVKFQSDALRVLTQRSPGNCRGHPRALSTPRPSAAGSGVAYTDHRTVYEHRSTEDLCRSLLVLRLCSFPPFVRHSEWLLGAATASATTAAPHWLREAFYAHFCAGRAPAEVWARMNGLRANGVGAILDFAAEARETTAAGAAATRARAGAATPLLLPLRHDNFETDTETAAEAVCNVRLEAFLASVDTAAALPGTGFAAVQLSALAGPGLLEALAAALGRLQLLLVGEAEGDGDGADLVFRRDAEAACVELRTAPSLDVGSGSSSGSSESTTVPSSSYPSHLLSLSAAQRRQLEALQGRLERLVERAVGKGVKLMLEAGCEGQDGPLRPALEYIAHGLMRRHNGTAAEGAVGDVCPAGDGGAAVFLSYPAHLPDAPQRLAADLARATRERYTLGVQLVGGPADPGTSSPSASEVACLGLLLGAVQSGAAEAMVWSHSRAGVEAAVAAMSRLGLEPEAAPVYFGQMLGVADSISFAQGAAGYRVYKHCPLGDVDKVMPYLVRRVCETRAALEATGLEEELCLIQSELWRRMVAEPAAEARAAAAEALAGFGRGGGGGHVHDHDHDHGQGHGGVVVRQLNGS